MTNVPIAPQASPPRIALREFGGQLDEMRQNLAQLLPPSIPPERLVRTALMAVQLPDEASRERHMHALTCDALAALRDAGTSVDLDHAWTAAQAAFREAGAPVPSEVEAVHHDRLDTRT
jgi:hypothetical protein